MVEVVEAWKAWLCLVTPPLWDPPLTQQLGLPKERKIMLHLWAFHLIFRFSFWLTKLPKTEIGCVIFCMMFSICKERAYRKITVLKQIHTNSWTPSGTSFTSWTKIVPLNPPISSKYVWSAVIIFGSSTQPSLSLSRSSAKTVATWDSLLLALLVPRTLIPNASVYHG